MKKLMENWRKFLRESGTLTKRELEALQRVKDGLRSETDARRALMLSRLVDRGLIDGDVKTGQSHKKTKRGFQAVGYRTVSNMSITPEGESALSAGLQKSSDDSEKFKKVIMQAIIDAPAYPISIDKLPGYNPKTFKLRGKYREAYDELRGFGSDINALSVENTEQGRVVSPGPDFEKVMRELGFRDEPELAERDWQKESEKLKDHPNKKARILDTGANKETGGGTGHRKLDKRRGKSAPPGAGGV